MKRLLGIICLILGMTASAAEADDFFGLLEDVPVMTGLAPVADAGITFDAPSGRIVEAYAIGAVSRQGVLDFYSSTLPQLGWQPGAGASFVREGESLSIDFFGPDGELTVRFTVAPVSN